MPLAQVNCIYGANFIIKKGLCHEKIISLLLSLVLLFGIGAEQQRKALAKARLFSQL